MMYNAFDAIYHKCNTGINKYKHKTMPDFPDLIDIELTNKCNLRCKMCPTGRREVKREIGFMRKDVYLKIFKELKMYSTPVRYIRWGEPMKHPNFWEFIGITAPSLVVHVNTNGYYLDEMAFRLFSESSVGSIKLSVHNKGRQARTAMKWMSKLNYIHTHVSFTSDEPTVSVRNGIDKISTCKTFWEGKNYPRPKNCPEVFNKMSINWDGTVSACCADYDKKMVVGDVNKQSLKDIWEGKKFNKIRNMILKDKHWNHPVCKNCYDLEIK